MKLDSPQPTNFSCIPIAKQSLHCSIWSKLAAIGQSYKKQATKNGTEVHYLAQNRFCGYPSLPRGEKQNYDNEENRQLYRRFENHTSKGEYSKSPNFASKPGREQRPINPISS